MYSLDCLIGEIPMLVFAVFGNEFYLMILLSV